MKYKVFNQFGDNDCASAAVKMLMYECYNINLSISELTNNLNTNRQGTQINSIYNYLSQIKTNPKVLECVKDLNVFDEISFPCITQIMHNNELHYVTIFKITKRHIIYGDPLKFEIQKINRKNFINIWIPIVITVDKNIKLNLQEKLMNDQPFEFKGLIKDFKRPIITIFIISLIGYAASVILASMYAIYFDFLIPSKTTFLITNFMVLFLMVAIFHFILSLLKARFIIKYTNKLDANYINKLISSLLRTKYDSIHNMDTGELITRFTQIQYIRERFIALTQLIPLNIVIIFITLIILCNQNLVLSSLVFVPIIIYSLLYILTKEKYEKLGFEMYNKSEAFNNKFIESISNISTIKSYNLNNNISKSLSNLLNKFLLVTQRFGYYDSLLNVFREFVENTFTILLFSLGVYTIINGDLAQGQFLMFNALVFKVLDPFSEIVNLQAELQKGIVAEEKFNDILLSQNEQLGESNKQKVDFESLELKNINYSYNSQSRKVLNNCNFSINKNEKVAIIGLNGAGKSTFAKIIAGLISNFEGEILINGKSYKEYNLSDIRLMVSHVTEHVEIFSGTIMQNITLNFKDEDLSSLIKLPFNNIASKFPYGYSTVIGNNGLSMSKGQLQLLNISRAYYKRSGLHIYDEATSGLDVQNKKIIEDFILKDKTAKIIITHDLALASRCDKIFIFKDGNIKKISKNTINENLEDYNEENYFSND